MIQLLNNIPRSVTIALSGGVDSMAVLDFLSYNHDVTAAFFHHGTTASDQALEFLNKECHERHVSLIVGKISAITPSKGVSKEEHWRLERYEFLSKFPSVITAHHLDDVAETWIWSSLHGQSKLLPYSRGNVIRPFLLNRKYDLENWANRKSVKYVYDASNNDLSYTRNFIRHELMNKAVKVNPGLHSMLKRKIEEKFKNKLTDYKKADTISVNKLLEVVDVI